MQKIHADMKADDHGVSTIDRFRASNSAQIFNVVTSISVQLAPSATASKITGHSFTVNRSMNLDTFCNVSKSIRTRCSSFFRRKAGCSCSTESASMFNVLSTCDSTFSSGCNFDPEEPSVPLLMACNAASTSSLHSIWAANTTICAWNHKCINLASGYAFHRV